MSLPSINSLGHILFNEANCEQYLWESGVYYRVMPCESCGDEMHGKLDTRRFRCCRRSCNTVMSLRAHTFFSGSKLKATSIMQLGYHWLNRLSQTQAVNATGCSSGTVTSFFGHFRSLVASTLDDDDTRIGGPGVIVQLDETKLGKRKYHRGHRVEGVWVFAGVEVTEERKVFLRRVQDRSASTLEAIITEHVKPGSRIHTDLWKGYAGIASHLEFVHDTVNHSKYFKDPVTGVNTNAIEGTNNALKIQIRPRNRTQDVDEHLSEFIWRRKNSARLWLAFLEAMRDIHYDIE